MVSYVSENAAATRHVPVDGLGEQLGGLVGPKRDSRPTSSCSVVIVVSLEVTRAPRTYRGH
jgi:hypothetical protein